MLDQYFQQVLEKLERSNADPERKRAMREEMKERLAKTRAAVIESGHPYMGSTGNKAK